MIEIRGRHARFTFTRCLPCHPGELFRWLTEPTRIARWSTAQVTMREPFRVGAERTVTIRLGKVRVRRLVEQIVAVEPGRGFAYVGSSVAGHRGEVRLSRQRLGTALHWEACFDAPHPVLAWPVARFVSGQIEHSLARLGQALEAER